MIDDEVVQADSDEAGPLPAGMRYEHGVVVPHLTAEQRVARGKAARREVPRESHAEFTPGLLRRDPVDLLESQAGSRVAELVPIRYGRMLVSPFTFYRGAALVMAADLAGTPRSGITTQVCGDAHLMNFGLFASPERQMAFGINDFDETSPGPWEWDVKRLAVSFAIAGRDNGYEAKARRTVLLALLGAYRTAIREFAAMSNLSVWYAHTSIDDEVKVLQTRVDKATESVPRPTSRRPVPVTALRRSTSSRASSTGSLGSSAIRRSSSPSRNSSTASSSTSSWTSCVPFCAVTAAPCRVTVATSSRNSNSSTRPVKSWASAASAPAHGSCC